MKKIPRRLQASTLPVLARFSRRPTRAITSSSGASLIPRYMLIRLDMACTLPRSARSFRWCMDFETSATVPTPSRYISAHLFLHQGSPNLAPFSKSDRALPGFRSTATPSTYIFPRILIDSILSLSDNKHNDSIFL